MSAQDQNKAGVRSSYAPSSNRSRVSGVVNKRSRASMPSSTFQKPKQTSNKRQSDVNMEESPISVYVRCRSRNEREIKENSGVVVSTMGHMGKEVVLQTGPMAVSNKTYTFDRVFGAESDQDMVYDGIASGVLDEMLQGYNCTVFAYGQTGTGKTYTMSGDIEMIGNQLSENAGIIPRTLVALFKQLEKSPEFSVKVSFIELYNEELRDLLVQNESGERKVKIFEDPNKKSIVVQGMEEIFIKTATEGMKVLADGSYKRQVAATQCNDLSSRSHSVFTITVHMKEIDPLSGEEYLKIGKLNLVDLAGSENINRSGAENKRAREAGMINQSLLTLGRVINALVDQSPHIPYRESKLTRLLQDSLGGQTKTCIIATISPAKVSLEETISTLEYANRAKNIKNKPQVNSSMSKKMLIKEYVQEIERLRNDLNATRSKNGIYLTEDNWQQVTAESESRRIQVEEQKLRMDVLEEQIRKFKTNFEAQLEQINKVERDLELSKQQCAEVGHKLADTSQLLQKTEQQLRLETFVSDEYSSTENELHKIGNSLALLLQDVVESKNKLHDTIERKLQLEKKNLELLDTTKNDVRARTNTIGSEIIQFHKDSSNLAAVLNHNFSDMVAHQQSKIKEECHNIKKVSEKAGKQLEGVINNVIAKKERTNIEISNIEEVKEQIKSQIVCKLNALKDESSNTSKALLLDLENLEKVIDENFEALSQQVKHILGTAESQLETQASEIVELKTKLVEHQMKYVELIRQQSLRLESVKEAEKERSKVEKEELLTKITSLIDSYDANRNIRITNEIDSIKPELEMIANRQQDFTTNFDNFITENWINTQKEFQQRLQTQSEEFQSCTKTSSSIIRDNSINRISSTIVESENLQASKFNDSISTLDQGLVNLTQFADLLKTINDENAEFTQEKLREVKSGVSKSFKDISQDFLKFGEALQEAKPQLVDDFLQKQAAFLSEFKKSALDSVGSLNQFVSSVSYMKDDEQPPKRQKVDIRKDLPRSKTREQVEKAHYQQIYGAPVTSSSELGDVETESLDNRLSMSPVPVPDKPFKQPLGTSIRDMNVIRSNPGDKLKQQGKKSRSGSSLSQRSE